MGGSWTCRPRSGIQSVSAPRVLTLPLTETAGDEHVFHTGQKMGGPTKGRESAQAGDPPRLPLMQSDINLSEITMTTKPRGDPKVGIRGSGVTLQWSQLQSLHPRGKSKGWCKAETGQLGLWIKSNPPSRCCMAHKNRFYICK